MKRLAILSALAAAAAVAGCANSNVQMPTARQVEQNVPASVRRCPRWPSSPGAKATRRQTASYLVRARDAYQVCGGNMQAVDRLLSQRDAAIGRLNRNR